GNELRDLRVWRRARHSIVVSPGWWLSRRLTTVPRLERVFPGSCNKSAAWLRALRVHQWTKNLLVFVPLVAAHQYSNLAAVTAGLAAFFAFSVCASATYIINDLFDLEADRAHPRKCRRPFAACDLSILEGCIAAVVLVAVGFAAALLWLPLTFSLVLAFYLAITLWYSSYLKRLAMVDILSLTGLYTLRIIAGAAATRIIPSFWLLAFSMFIFLSLAAAKRYIELHAVAERGETQAAGRGYTTVDLPLVLACGVASGYTAVLIVALYVQSSAAALYSHPLLLWLLCPIVLYWISRIWLKTHRGQLHDDPLVFAMTDRPSIVALLLLVALAAGAA
ncbi:MAG: UbiA family prenyltransferase, partial [Steroidobacteraceae bacterium]